MSMAKNKSGSAASRLARWRGWVQAGFLLAWLDPLDAPHAHRLRAGVSLLLVSAGHVRLPDRRAGQLQRPAPDPLRGLGHAGGCGRACSAVSSAAGPARSASCRT